MPPDTAPVAAPAPDAPLAPASSDLLQAPPALTRRAGPSKEGGAIRQGWLRSARGCWRSRSFEAVA